MSENTTVSRRQLLQFAGLGAAGLLLAGCMPSGGGSGSPSSSPSAGLGAGDFTASDFSFSSWSLTEEAAAPATRALLDGYKKTNDVGITEVSFPYNEYFKQLMLQVRGGQFTGAAHVDVAWLASLAALGKLEDVSALTKGRGYTASSLEATQLDGKQYAFPWTIGAIGLITNSELLTKAGISAFPTTVDDFEAALKKLKSLGGGLIPYAASTKAAQLKDVLIWMQTFGSDLVKDGTVTIGDDASIEAVTWYKSLYDQGLIAADVDRFDARSLFAQGRAAIYDDAPVGRASVTKDSPDPDLASKLVPESRPVLKNGDTPRALVWGGAIAVVGGGAGDSTRTAADFGQWATSDLKAVLGDYALRGLPPVTEEAQASKEVASDAFGSRFAEKITATATTNPFWQYPQYAQIETVIADRVQAVLVGQQSAEDAMAQAGDEAQKLLG
ncbi:extracellular solute-binding protein [Microbacterium resistens]|uniref:extracellular solute-binding protein n=1 Tax=Microbacterium resistens TaxID=156977 RepID=UPI00082E128E|nr:extracellular solute-binding protein [Microbacterium resistens]MBW1640410.1 extracellular solute-binding protein [Microbacterium resistens]